MSTPKKILPFFSSTKPLKTLTFPSFNFSVFLIFVVISSSVWNITNGEETVLHFGMFDGIKESITGGNNVSLQITQGVLMGVTRQGILIEDHLFRQVDWFLGVPYAKPPVGALRFKKPEKCDEWTGVKEAKKYGSTCPMFWDTGNKTLRLSYNSNEDCLFLNVFTPLNSLLQHEKIPLASHQNIIQRGLKPAYLLPVMLFIHGGSYEHGSGNVYVGDTLAQFGVVVVTINYRLGMLGFLSAQSKHLRGNWGLHDQIAALKWVQDNIGYFGGDANRVTVFGNSAGASSVGILSLSPLAKGLFKHAIIQSGSPLGYWAYYRHRDVNLRDRFRHLAYLANCSGRKDFNYDSSAGKGWSNDGFSRSNGERESKKCGIGGSIGKSEDMSPYSQFSNSDRYKNVKNSVEGDDDDIKEMVECFRGLKVYDLFTDTYNALGLPIIKPTKDDDLPCMDGEVMMGTIEESFKQGLFHVDKLMIGTVSNEWSKHLGTYTSDFQHELKNARREDDKDDNITEGDENSKNEEERSFYKNTLRFILKKKLGYSEELVKLAQFIYFPSIIKKTSTIVQQYIKFVADISFLVPSINYAKLASNSSDVYFYVYNHYSNEGKVAWQNNYHTVELNYIFGGPFRGSHIQDEFIQDFTQDDMEASMYAMKLWTNFAKTGNPNYDGTTHESMNWEPFNGDNFTYANISIPAASHVEYNLRSYYVEFWNKIAPEIENLALQNCKNLYCGKKGDISKDAVYIVAVVCLLALVAALSIGLCAICLKSQFKDSEA